MVTRTHTSSIAHRLGRALSGARRWIAAQEVRAVRFAVGVGVSAPGVRGLFWLFKLGILIALCFIGFWAVVLVAFAIFAFNLVPNSQLAELVEDEETEWKVGAGGYGLYRGNIRIDPGGSDDNY